MITTEKENFDHIKKFFENERTHIDVFNKINDAYSIANSSIFDSNPFQINGSILFTSMTLSTAVFFLYENKIELALKFFLYSASVHFLEHISDFKINARDERYYAERLIKYNDSLWKYTHKELTFANEYADIKLSEAYKDYLLVDELFKDTYLKNNLDLDYRIKAFDNAVHRLNNTWEFELDKGVPAN
ncbi:MAG: hypothetical protein ACK4OM_03235, partial [Alphaproteobacteria bacterium]